MGKIWLTSDTHFGHDKNFIWQPRGYNSVYESDKDLIKKWNEVVGPEDDIYHLGDVMLGDNEYGLSCVKQLKGNIHLVRGNHDTDARMKLYNQCYNIVEITEGQFLKYKKYHFFLSHYPCLTSNFDGDKPLKTRTISLCGHYHSSDPYVDFDKGLIYHVEVDGNNGCPWDLDTIIENIINKTKGEK